jgi:hypothetical protein
MAYAQEVEHNYLVGPQNTDCDSLEIEGVSKDKAIEFIESTTFRFERQFRLRRQSGLMGGWMYSCDYQSGFLIVLFDSVRFLYADVPVAEWDALVGAANPEVYYLETVRRKYTPFE